MTRDEDQELWDLLGKASVPGLSPFFARNVLRELREESRWRRIFNQWLSPRRALVATAAAAICLAATLTLTHRAGSKNSDANEEVPDVVAQIHPNDFEVVADLDDLVAGQENDSWDDTATL